MCFFCGRYEFKSGELLNRAISHASYPLDNNRALAVPGLDAMMAAVAVRAIRADLDVSSQSINRRIEAATGGKTCATGGRRLGLEKVVKVAGRTNASADSVVCGPYRAVFGPVAIDAGKADDAGDVF